MSATLKWDMRMFNETLKRAAAESSRAAPDVINGHALAVANNAIKMTEKADKEEIARILGQAGTNLNYTKSGKRLRKKSAGGAFAGEDSFAARIVNARRRDFAGADYMIHGRALEIAAGKLIDARKRAVNFIRAGWIWALRDIGAVVRGRKGATDKDVKAAGARKGKGVPAPKTGSVFKATIENTALIASGGQFQSKGTHNPLPVAEKGLAAAMRAEQANMEKHLADKMKEAMRKAGAM